MNNKYTVIQGFEPKPEGGDSVYWMVTSGQSGLVMGVFDTELEANNHANLLTNNLPQTPAAEAAAEALTDEQITYLAENPRQAEKWILTPADIEAIESRHKELASTIPAPLAELDALRKELGEYRVERLALLNRIETLEFDDKIKAESIDGLVAKNEALQAENARLKKFALDTLMGISMSNYPQDLLQEITEASKTVGLSLGVISDMAERYIERIIAPAPSPAPAPEAVTHATTTLMVDDIVVLKNGNGIQMIVYEIVGNRCRVVYRHAKNLGEFPIADLMLDYRPSWNKNAIAKASAEAEDNKPL